MNESTRLKRWFRTALIAIALQVSCVRAQATPADEKLSWDSPKIRQIENEWQSLQDTYHNTPEKIPGGGGKDQYVLFSLLENALLERRFSDRELQQLASGTELIPDRAFTDQVVDCMVWRFVETNDRADLVTLLSKRCTGLVGSQTIEFCLAYWGSQLKDPILVLGEAFSNSKSPENCHNLAIAVRRGFSGHGIQGRADADYVNNAMRWYEKRKTT